MSKLEIVRVGPEDIDAAGSLFTFYPFKTVQQSAQNLDRQKLDAFFQASLANQVRDPSQTVLMAREKRGPAALAALGGNAWHSSIYGMTMGRVQPWLNTVNQAAGRPLLKAIEQAAKEAGMEHLSVRIDGADYFNLHLFEKKGWYLVDVSVKLSLEMPLNSRRIVGHRIPRKMKVGTAEIHDAEWIRRIGSQSHSGTHFLNDPALDPEKTRELFAKWLERCINGMAYRIYVVRDEDGQQLGFVTYLTSKAFHEATGRRPLVLDFVLMDPSARGRGLGPWFIEETLLRESHEGFDYCELRTSTHNLAALASYEKLGFRCCATDFVLHKVQ